MATAEVAPAEECSGDCVDGGQRGKWCQILPELDTELQNTKRPWQGGRREAEREEWLGL